LPKFVLYTPNAMLQKKTSQSAQMQKLGDNVGDIEPSRGGDEEIFVNHYSQQIFFLCQRVMRKLVCWQTLTITGYSFP